MKRRNFMKWAGLFATAPVFSMNQMPGLLNESKSFKNKEVYEWRIYWLTKDGVLLDEFLKKTFIPAYNRLDVKVGAFGLFETKNDEPDKRHLLLIYKDLQAYQQAQEMLWKDDLFIRDSKAFYDTTAASPVYSNIETYLSTAFDKLPMHRKPGSERSLFEFRVYWSPNEEANKRKVKMFNCGEIDIFDQCGIHSVCYGDVLAGPRVPALLYLTWYNDMEARTKAWNEFRNHPDWLRMKALPEYAHTATNNQNTLLNPLPYSQL